MGAPQIPDVELETPSGHRVTIAPRSPDDRLGDLADALGLDPRRPLQLDGRPVGRHETLGRCGLVRGSRLEPAPAPMPLSSHGEHPVDAAGQPPAVSRRSAGAAVTVVVEAGPCAGTAVTLRAGRHIVGRSAAAAVPIGDPSLEPHHGMLEIDDDGRVRFVQLTGRVACRVDDGVISGPTDVPAGTTVVLGATRLRVGGTVVPGAYEPVTGQAALTADPVDPWRRTLHRTPRARLRWEAVPIPRPSAEPASRLPSGLGMMAAVFTLVGSVLVAVVMRSPMFLLFGAVGLFASIGMWAAGRIGVARDGRRDGARRRRELASFTAAVDEQRQHRWRYHLATTPTIADAVVAASEPRADVWARRADHDDAFRATLGWGPVAWEVAVAGGGPGIDAADLAGAGLSSVLAAAGHFADAPVAVELGAGASLAVSGPGAAGAVRSIITQLATWTGPADWRLVVLVDDVMAWDWCRWLPHVAGPAGSPSPTVVGADATDDVTAMLTRLDDGDDRHVIVVTDRPDLLAQRTGPLRRYLGSSSSVAVVVHVPPAESVPAMCHSVLEIGSIGMAHWWPDASSPTRSDAVHVTGVSPAVATLVARSLARLRDPEDPAVATHALASAVSLGLLCEQHGVGPIDDPIAIAAAWRSAGADPAPAAPIGVTGDGVIEVDLARDGPHALVAGTTGAGKSELLRTLVVSLAARCSPDHLTFVLVDYKGGSTFDACADLPHTVGVVTDLDDRLAERALVSLDAEVRRRERLLRAVGAADLADYRALALRDDVGRAALPRLVVVIDEFAALAAELPTFLSALVGIAQRGRSLGIHLVLATQRPAGVVDDDIRANTNLRMALRLQDVADARDVVGDDHPVSFPRGTPGRTMLRLGPGETVVFQAAHSSGPVTARRDEHLRVVDVGKPAAGGETTELAVLVHAIRHAAALSDVPAPHRPWLPPLPAELERAPADDAVGLVDVPSDQRRDALRWSPADGNLALIGALGSGTTTALVALVAAACHGRAPADLHVYVLDARGDGAVDVLDRWAHCAGVVRPHERERLSRVLQRLVDELDRRKASGQGQADAPSIVLAVDGIAAARAALSGPADGYEQLLRVVEEGAAVGISTVVTAERAGAVPAAILAACADRWVFHLDDPTEAGVCGLRSSLVPADVPGRLVVASTGCHAQVAATVPRPPDGAGGGPVPVATLPRVVDAATVPNGASTGDGGVALVVGVDFRTLDPARLDVPDGEHVLVAGPPRSGRTTALLRLAESWLDVRPAGAIRVVSGTGRHTPLSEWTVLGRDVRSVEAEAVAVVDAVARMAGRPCLIVVDDAERVDDPQGALAGLVAERRPGVLVLAAGRPEGLRTLYGHWTGIVRRSRLGLLMAGCADTDGDVLGELLPRHPPLPARPGLAWVVAAGSRSLAQVATRLAPAVTDPGGDQSVATGRRDGPISALARNASRHDSLRPVCRTERS